MQLHLHHQEMCFNQFCLANKFADILEQISEMRYVLYESEHPFILNMRVPDLPDWVRAHFILAVEFEAWNAAGYQDEKDTEDYEAKYNDRVVWDQFKEEMESNSVRCPRLV